MNYQPVVSTEKGRIRPSKSTLKMIDVDESGFTQKEYGFLRAEIPVVDNAKLREIVLEGASSAEIS